MRVLLVITLLVGSCVLLSESAVVKDSLDVNQELFLYKHQNRLVYRQLAEECPEEVKAKRDAADEIKLHTDLEIQRLQYNALLNKLIECRKRNHNVQPTGVKTGQSTTTAPVTAIKSTTAKPRTTAQPKPAQCISATNLTESWRMDHDGKNLKGGGPNNLNGRACDLRRELQWFRFTGDAGTQLLNKCTKQYSCGSSAAIWTDAALPTAIGVPTNVTVYGSHSPDYSSRCKEWTIQIEVMRCSMSTDHDFIYRYTGIQGGYDYYSDACGFAFCGM